MESKRASGYLTFVLKFNGFSSKRDSWKFNFLFHITKWVLISVLTFPLPDTLSIIREIMQVHVFVKAPNVSQGFPSNLLNFISESHVSCRTFFCSPTCDIYTKISVDDRPCLALPKIMPSMVLKIFYICGKMAQAFCQIWHTSPISDHI